MLLDQLVDARRPHLDHRRDELPGPLDEFHVLLADVAGQDAADVGPGQAHQLQEEGDNTAQREVARHLDADAAQPGEEPAQQAVQEVRAEVVEELLEALGQRGHQVVGEAQRVIGDVVDDLLDARHQRPERAGRDAQDAQQAVDDRPRRVVDEGGDGVDDAAEQPLGRLAQFVDAHAHVLDGLRGALGQVAVEVVARLVGPLAQAAQLPLEALALAGGPLLQLGRQAVVDGGDVAVGLGDERLAGGDDGVDRGRNLQDQGADAIAKGLFGVVILLRHPVGQAGH